MHVAVSGVKILKSHMKFLGGCPFTLNVQTYIIAISIFRSHGVGNQGDGGNKSLN